ncbi:MAG: M15 family metallopeptidase [Lachnospiraceae bacterium]|nr:M15 family metallopeptidase [Lachnospiraceae bacterium]
MKKLNPYSHLLIRMTLVLLIVVTATFLNRTDADARAEAGGGSSGNEIAEYAGIGDNTAKNGIDGSGGNGAEDGSENRREDTLPVQTGKNSSGNDGNAGYADDGGTGINGNAGGQRADGDDGSGIQNGNNGSIASNNGTANSNITNMDPIGSDAGKDPNGNIGTDVPGNDNSNITVYGDNVLEPAGSGSGEETLTEEELKAIAEAEAAAKLAEYKKTQEYIDSLLVTHPDHYNAEVVENARSIPLASDNDRYLYITGKDKKIYKVGGMPDGYGNDTEAKNRMVTLDVPVWKMKNNGEKYSSYWPITINAKLADSIRCIFSDIYLLDIKFPFNYLIGYSYRKVGGVGLVNSKLMSTHAFGVALDINLGDFDNDYFLGKGNDLRNKNNPYCIPDEVIKIFEDYGWFWGGNYEICADTMHFQYFELGFLKYDSDEPFPILSRGAENMDPVVIRNLSQRLVKLGYLEKETQKFNKKVEKAVKKFQEEHELEPTGIVDYATWEPLINLTHYMTYVF